MCSWKFCGKLIEVLQAIAGSMPFILFYLVPLLPGESQLIKKLYFELTIILKTLSYLCMLKTTEFCFKSILLVYFGQL